MKRIIRPFKGKLVLIATASFLITSLISPGISGQVYIPFPDANAIWSEIYTNQQPFEVNTYQYGVSGDTIINSTSYHKIYQLADTLYPLTPGQFRGAIREDNKRIFVISYNSVFPGSGNSEVLLYDFTKKAGDTIFVGQDGIGPEGYLVIDHIDSVLIDNNYRKTFFFTTLEEFYWIEGIGSTRGLFSPITAQPTGYQKWQLICFNQDGDVKYLNPEFNSCFQNFNGIEDNSNTNKLVDIIPNPIVEQGVMKLDNTNNNLNVLEIYDLFGQIISRINITNKSQVNLNRVEYNPGTYFYRISGHIMIPFTGKIIFE